MIITLQTLMFFRETLLKALDSILRPYYNKFALTFGRNGDVSDEELDEQVFAEFDEEKGVVFYPPVYLQRYAAVSDCLMDERWSGKLEKVVDLGYHDMSFIKYLKEVSGIQCILGVDIESIPLRCLSDLIGCDDYGPKREKPLQVTLFQGNAADPDYRLIGCDAVVAIEMIEHMLPQDLDRLIHTVFGFIKPWVAIFTTPNGSFNVLFKAMEKNGLRRLDHFFEWSREQFNDWCSNIVTRYPEYTVSCKGIGPGPAGTLHLGCCSQMAVFISKDYHKQQDLNLDSLALVSNAPNPYNVSDLIGPWDSSAVPNENNTMCPLNLVESYTELYSEKQSCVTILITTQSIQKSEYTIDTESLLRSTATRLAAFEQHDKTSQCNLDVEAGKNYMMFDYEEMCYDVVVPRRKIDNRVYMIEDVNSRLNCSTLQINKFSKTSQNLIAKNKVDSLVHTREVIDEIRHLTKMLNFNRSGINQSIENGVHIWHNINWGDNAPYWNQYYKLVREYNPPYETKSDEDRITELISDEINRLVDTQFDDDEGSVELSRLEIPMERLMRVVDHITTDVEKVKDLLEWDGYQIVDNMVIHSRLVVDNASTLGTQEDDWPDDAVSECYSADVRSLSDGSTVVQDYHARCLHRALDQKVRKLRTMLTADEDITTELDRIVCRLMNLALHTSRGRQAPPPTRWMQCKLLDLLTLTEKAIDRRKRYFIENYPLNSISNDAPSEKSQEMITLEKIREDDTGLKIVDKYRHLVQPEKSGLKEESRAKYRFIDLELEDDLSLTTFGLLNDFEYLERKSPSLYEAKPALTDTAFDPANEKMKLKRTQAWLEDDLEVVSYPDHGINFDNDISSGDTEHSTSLTRYYKKSFKRYKPKKQSIELKCVICKTSHSKSFGRESKKEKKVKNNSSKTRNIKKESRKKSSYKNLLKDSNNKHASDGYRHYAAKPLKNECNVLQPTASKPIPKSLTKLCNPELMIEGKIETYKEHINNYTTTDDNSTQFNQSSGCISATKKSLLIDIVMDDIQETIAMKRTIGTDAGEDPMGFENETLIRSVSNTAIYEDTFFDKNDVGMDNDMTIFLNDINEPSTSKGIRHVSMDVQCGPDILATAYPILSAKTSITRMASIFTAGIKIEDSSTDTKINGTDCYTEHKSTDSCTLTNEGKNIYKTIAPRERSIDIKIKEPVSIKTLQKKTTDCCTSTNDDETIYKTIAPIDRAIGIKTKEAIPNNTERMECSTMMQGPELTRQEQEPTIVREQESPIVQEEEFNRTNTSSPLFTGCPTETTCLKLIPSGMKIEDSGSEFCSSISCSPKMPLSLANGLTRDLKIISSISKNVGVTRKLARYVRPKLCSGGLQVHSYRDKGTSEDIMYQGEWENSRPKILTKNKIYQVIVKRTTDSILKKKIASKEKLPPRSFVKRDIKAAPQKNTEKRNLEATKVKSDVEKTNNRMASKRTMSSTPHKNTKPVFIAKKLPVTVVTTTKDVQEAKRTVKKNYLPYYLRKNALKPLTNGKKNFNLSVDSAKTNICMKLNAPKPLVCLRTEDIKRDLLQFQSKVLEANYVILRNEVVNSANDGQSAKSTPDCGKRRGDPTKHSISPPSQNSSTCSSPSSIATVRAASIRPKNVSTRKHSTSSYKTTTTNSGSENTTPNRNKKFSKRSKSAKLSNEKTLDNKENIPQTSRQSNIIGKGSDKIIKGAFLGQKKEVFIAQLKESPTLQSTANKKLKSNVNIPKTDSIVEKRSTSPSVSKKSSLKSDDCIAANGNSMAASTGISNMVLILEPQRDEPHTHISDPPADTFNTPNIFNNRLITEWMDNSSININNSQSSNILAAMRMLVEETLDFIDGPYDNNYSIDSETVIMSREDLNNAAVDLSFSPISFKTVITNENNSFQSDLEQALIRSFDNTLGDDSILSMNDTKVTVTEFDLLSFKSITSVSKNSEYLSAGSSQVKLPLQSVHATSVKDIYERKIQPFIPIPQKNAGAIASQAFSGFTINDETIAGDNPDPINFVDSETGSMAVDVSRQANSEELFVSGVSSDSFESCLLDEEAVVPSWLFQIISQQEAENEMNAAQPLAVIPLPMPDDPIYDVNGNNVEGLGLGAGAGDGRGMHSDLSLDSSGSGTSLSSTATSSGSHSEQAILVDPVAFEGQFEGALLQDYESNSFVMVHDELLANQGATPVPPDSQRFSHGESIVTTRRAGTLVNITSDVDADVSSLETDVPDSSDN